MAADVFLFGQWR